MRLISWNVNGIRACITKGFLDVLESSGADVFCVQETKAQPEQLDGTDWPCGYKLFWNSAMRKGYSGTLTFVKSDPVSTTNGIGIEEHDSEGRVLTTELADMFVVNVYTPNSKRELLRLDYRANEWEPAFRTYVTKLAKKKPVAICGDFNVAHKEIDIARPKANERSAGFTIEERKEFSKLLDAGFVDTFREFCSEPERYSWWSYRAGARAKNIGWRLDYFVISDCLRPRLHSASIKPEIMGSDHCPVEIELM